MWRRTLLASLCLFSGCQRGEDPRLVAERQKVTELSNRLAIVREAAFQPNAVSTDATAESMQQVVAAQNEFAIDLYRKLAQDQGNLFFSPASISLALSLAMAGADGDTRAELTKALHFSAADQSLFDALASLNTFWGDTTADHGIELKVANALWGDQRIQFEKDYLQLAKDSFGATLRSLNFGDSDASRAVINQWVEQQTNNKIRELIPSGAIDSSTGLVLTNAIYFYGKWTLPFTESATKPDKFYVTSDESITVPMMHQSDSFIYADVEDAQLLRLPYGDETFSMVVVLPKAKDGLATLEAKLSSEQVAQWQQAFRNEPEVRVYLPRFKSESEFELSSVLQSLGVEKAFSVEEADFSKITGTERLFVSKVIHKSFVDVNEKGTEAAAATGIVMATASAPVEKKEPPTFRADHPFIYLIQDNRTQQIVFLGRMTAPDASESK